VNSQPLATHVVDGHAYVIDEHRMIQEPGPFEHLPIYAPYFWNAYLDGTFDDEQWINGEHIVVFVVTEDDRYDYPELAGTTKLTISEAADGRLSTRVDRTL